MRGVPGCGRARPSEPGSPAREPARKAAAPRKSSLKIWGCRGGGRGRCSPPGAVRGVPVPTLQSAGWPRGPGVNGLLPAGLRAGVPGRLGSDSIINPATQDHESPLSHPGGVRPGAQGDREMWIQPPHAPCPARRVRLGVRWTLVPAVGRPPQQRAGSRPRKSSRCGRCGPLASVSPPVSGKLVHGRQFSEQFLQSVSSEGLGVSSALGSFPLYVRNALSTFSDFVFFCPVNVFLQSCGAGCLPAGRGGPLALGPWVPS